MTIYGLYRAFIDWAAAPVAMPENENAHTENALLRMSPRDLADLPIGPEPTEAVRPPDRRHDRCA